MLVKIKLPKRKLNSIAYNKFRILPFLREKKKQLRTTFSLFDD